MRPGIRWRAGDPRVTPVGTPLEGHRRDTYWSNTVTPKWVRVPAGKTAEQELIKLVRRLRPYARFLNRFRSAGGRAEIWLSAYSTRNHSFVFQPTLIEAFHNLGCEFIIDIYPHRQR